MRHQTLKDIRFAAVCCLFQPLTCGFIKLFSGTFCSQGCFCGCPDCFIHLRGHQAVDGAELILSQSFEEISSPSFFTLRAFWLCKFFTSSVSTVTWFTKLATNLS